MPKRTDIHSILVLGAGPIVIGQAADHRPGAARRPAADGGRADRAQPGCGPGRKRRARFGVELIGASLRAMQLAEDRQLFKETLTQAGLECPRSGLASSLEEAQAVTEEIGRFPLLIRASFNLGGSGGGIAYDA